MEEGSGSDRPGLSSFYPTVRPPKKSDSDTPLELSAEAIAAEERFRYKNYASEEAISEAVMKLPEIRDMDLATQVFRNLWVRAVDWGAKWQENQVTLLTRTVETAKAQIDRLEAANERAAARIRLLEETIRTRDAEYRRKG